MNRFSFSRFEKRKRKIKTSENCCLAFQTLEFKQIALFRFALVVPLTRHVFKSEIPLVIKAEVQQELTLLRFDFHIVVYPNFDRGFRKFLNFLSSETGFGFKRALSLNFGFFFFFFLDTA